ncbi:hypothetical protein JCM8547_000014 [Rhodosporidiobolus lusitaniae]
MSAQQPRITLRPPPHRDFLSGYPGIPASDPAATSPPNPDPIDPLPFLLRPQAVLSGTVEIRSPTKGPPVRARWLSIELEKIETVPPAPAPAQAEGDGKKKDANAVKKEGRFVELIGTGPNKLWEASEVPLRSSAKSFGDSPRKKGFKGMLKGKGGGDDEDEDDGFDLIPDGNYPFKISLPEGLPPTIEVDSKLNGVSYQIVASLCCKGKKGLLKGPAKPAIFVASAPILLDKADLLGWPCFKPVLPTPLPPKLPWAAPPGELTLGETRESKLAIRRDDGTAGEVWLKATRPSSAYGPGDAVGIFVQVGWGGDKPIKLTRIDAVLRETLTFRYPSPANPQYIIRAPPKVTSLFQATTSVSPDPDANPSAFCILYSNEPVGFELNGVVPSDHTRVTVRTAKHVDVAYHLKIRAMIEGGDEISVDNWSCVIGNVSSRVGQGIMNEIGWVEGLCDRPGLPSSSAAADVPPTRPSPLPASAPTRAIPASSPSPAQPPPSASPVLDRSFVDSATEKARLLNGSSHLTPPSTGNFHVANPSPSPLPAPSPIRPSYAPTSAEEEKRRYYEQATRSRDALQASLLSANAPVPSPTATDLTQKTGTGESALSPGAASAEDDHAALHHAAVVTRNNGANGLVRKVSCGDDLNAQDAPLVARAHLTTPARSNTTRAFSGSPVSFDPSPDRSPPVSATTASAATILGRSLTTAESEKRRLFMEAKETARRRQEEARLALEEQNRLLAEMDFEEAQNAYEDRLIAEAELEKRTEERARLDAFEAQQRERIAAEEAQWQREEEERRARALAELDEKKRRAEQALREEMQRFEQQQRTAEAEREEEIARQIAERKAEDDMKRRKAEELRRQDEEREREEEQRRLALSRKREMERQRAEDEARRRAAEEDRLAEIARRRAAEEEEARLRAEAQAQWEAEQEALRRRDAEIAAAAAEEAARRRDEEMRQREEEELRRREEEDARRREEDARRREEDDYRRRREEHEARIRQEQTAAAERNVNSTPAYPYSLVESYSSPPQHIVAGIERAPSVASFAPSIPAAAADANFYASSMAPSGMSEEKAAYLRQLRGQTTSSPLASRSSLNRRPSQSQPPTNAYSADPSARANLYHGYHSQPAYPQPPQPPDHPSYPSPPTRQDSYIPTGPAYPQRYEQDSATPPIPPQPPVPASSSSSSGARYPTAAEEKREAEARRRAEDARGKEAAIPEEEDLPPSYAVPGSAAAPSRERSAAEEKAELERYYSAKAAVEQHQSRAPPPPAPPARHDTLYTGVSSTATPAPSYQPSSYSSPPPPHQAFDGPAYPSQFSSSAAGNGSAPPPPAPLRSDSTPGSSAYDHDAAYRDPSIAAGKRPVQRSTSGASLSGNGYVPTAPPPVPPAPAGYAYASPPPPPPTESQVSYPSDVARHEAHQVLNGSGLGESGFGSFHLEDSQAAFGEFEQLRDQIAASNAARTAAAQNRA